MAEKHQVDKSIDELVDIRDVKLDSSLGQAERIQSFLQQIKKSLLLQSGRCCCQCGLYRGWSNPKRLLC